MGFPTAAPKGLAGQPNLLRTPACQQSETLQCHVQGEVAKHCYEEDGCQEKMSSKKTKQKHFLPFSMKLLVRLYFQDLLAKIALPCPQQIWDQASLVSF